MSALTADDVELYTGGRLLANDDETERLLSTALTAARRWCGWHVHPVIEDDTITLDGPGTVDLALPTLALIELSAVTENGVALDIDDLEISGKGLVRKQYRAPWTDRYQGIAVTMTHGLAQADDFNAAVLAAVDIASLGTGRGDLIRKKIDDVEYQYSNGQGWTALPVGLLRQFRLESRP